MKKIIKLGICLVLCVLCITTAMNVNRNPFTTEVKASPIKGEIIHERFIVVPDSTILLKLWDERLYNSEIVPYYSISLDGGKSFVRTVQPSYELGLRYAHFDPLKGEPVVDPTLTSSTDTHLYIVQFVTQPLEEFKEAITALGGIVHHYIAQFAYLVEMNEAIRERVESLPYVRWVGPYHPAYRLEEFMRDNFGNAKEVYPLKRYNIQVLAVDEKSTVASRITAIGGLVNSADAGKLLVEATLTPEQLFEVIRWDEVLFVDQWSPYEGDMDIAREIGGANYIESVAGYNGSGVRGEVFDAGFNLQHVDFQSRPLIPHGTVGSASHGASTSGIVFGDGTGNPKGRGLLPAGQGIVGDYNYIGLEGPNRYTHTGEEVQAPYFCVFETASVGSAQTGQYTTISADTDAALFDFDIVHCQSMSNYASNQIVRPQAWAKNIVSGGGVYHYDTLTKADDMWSNGASIGPASDGRIKPDFCHFYDWIFTTTSGSTTAYTDNFGGTSGATPIIAGHFGLFFQMWSDGIFGNPVNPNGTVFENRPHMTTAKAFMIDTADQYPFNGTSHDKTRVHQGWGMPNVKNVYDLRNKFYIVDESDILAPFEVSQHSVFVEAGSPSLKITMTYADPPGNPAVQTQHRINDLTLKVISPSNITYWGNYGLIEHVWSLPGGNPDTKDTVENVFVQNPEPGAWTIEVSADEIIQDSHVETPELDADYALVVSPVLSAPLPPQIDGSAVGYTGKKSDFTFVTTDPGNSDVYYWIDWGDGTHEEWVGPCISGVPTTISHTWLNKGNYSITAKAKNIHGSESGWSDPFVITILGSTVSIDQLFGGLFRVNAVIKNIGGVNATNVQWKIQLKNGAFIGKNSSGTIANISPDGEQTIRSKLILGVGYTTISVTVESQDSSATRTQTGIILLFYIKVFLFPG